MAFWENDILHPSNLWLLLNFGMNENIPLGEINNPSSRNVISPFPEINLRFSTCCMRWIRALSSSSSRDVAASSLTRFPASTTSSFAYNRCISINRSCRMQSPSMNISQSACAARIALFRLLFLRQPRSS